jgi:hypothetical protein
MTKNNRSTILFSIVTILLPVNLLFNPDIGITPTINTSELGIPESATVNSQNGMIETSLTVNLPKVHILPDSPLYGIKRQIENLQMFFARDPQQQIDVLVKLGENRLAEGLQLLQKKKDDLATQSLNEHAGILGQIKTIRELIVEENKTGFIPSVVENQQYKNQLLSLLLGEYRYTWSR